jgi:hypothetical protein
VSGNWSVLTSINQWIRRFVQELGSSLRPRILSGWQNRDKKVWRLIQKPVCGKKEVTSKSAKAFDDVIMLRIADRRSSWSCGGVLAGC